MHIIKADHLDHPDQSDQLNDPDNPDRLNHSDQSNQSDYTDWSKIDQGDNYRICIFCLVLLHLHFCSMLVLT